MDRIGLIQLSDMQFGKKHTFGFPSDISKKLAYDILHLSEKFSFDTTYLIISGDISETAHTDEFKDALEQINIIVKRLSIDVNSIVLVPGNHDINWELSKISKSIGDENIKYSVYNEFIKKLANTKNEVNESYYPVINDYRFGLDFILINSCEKETHDCHIGYVDEDKLIRSLEKIEKNHIKVAIMHHRLDSASPDPRARIENAEVIEAILANHEVNIVLTGHIHQGLSQCVTKDDKSIIYSGSGSTGVNKDQRLDGLQNQYSIHILDRINKRIETFWRSYNPASKSKFGIGNWTEDNGCTSNPEIFKADFLDAYEINCESYTFDAKLIEKYNIRSNPFTFMNAEKITSNDLVLELFVSDETRHKSATRLIGDAIIRGPRGSGKTMLLRYLNIIGNMDFNSAILNNRKAQSLPVLINFSKIHRSEWGSNVDSIVNTADKLIFESVMDAIEKKSKELILPSFSSSLHQLKQRLIVIQKHEGSMITKIGDAIESTMTQFFDHVLLLIDEIAPIFPKTFFSNPEHGFYQWMNDIRNSGPFFTRVAVYPNDVSDILNEERFGTIVNLNFDIKKSEDYVSFRSYITDTVNSYLKSVSLDKENPITINDIIDIIEDGTDDSLEQLIYASDGSSRRFLSLMDKCLDYPKIEVLKKENVFKIISEYSTNLLSSYDRTSQEVALSIAKECKGSATYRFKLPGLSNALYNLHSGREELNIIKISELGTGKRATTYEFTYPYCILMDIHTHNIKDTRRVCPSRDRNTGKWITSVTKINREDLDYFRSTTRIIGIITEMDDDLCLIRGVDGVEYIAVEPKIDDLNIGNEVSFIATGDNAIDLIIMEQQPLF